MYKVIKYFTDLQDNEHPYNAGDTFPRDGLTAVSYTHLDVYKRQVYYISFSARGIYYL